MPDTLTATKMICLYSKCGKIFLADRNASIIHCPHCNATNVTSDELGIHRKFIIKVYSIIKNYHPLYFISSADSSDHPPLGIITGKGLEVLQKENLLKQIEATKIVETYFRHKWFLTDIKTSTYYELLSDQC